MGKISLSKLNLEKNTTINKVNILGQEVEILTYLPISEKIDLIDIAVQESISGTIVNPLLLEANFNMFIILCYTNIVLSKGQREQITTTYDLLEKNGVISMIIGSIPEEEYIELTDALDEVVKKTENRLGSFANLMKDSLETITGTLQENLGGIDLNSDSLQNILQIAKDNGIK